MRIGANPAKAGIPAYTPHTLGIALIVHIPVLEAYFKNALEILDFQIQSLWATTTQPFDLLVFDNGSCPEVVHRLRELQSQEQIEWLVLSRHNLGKAGAWNWILAAMPNELICYADSDVLFRPGWLEASLQILRTFPKPGMVSAQPNFHDVFEGQSKAHLAFVDDKRFEMGEYWPPAEIVDEYCYGIGASEELSERIRSAPLPYIIDQGTGIQAVLRASHMQFLIPQQVAQEVGPLPASQGLLRTETMELDFRIDELGYLHLSTPEPYVFHMGNNINPRLISEVAKVLGSALPFPSEGIETLSRSTWPYRWLSALAERPRFQRLFKRIYNLLFKVLYD